LQGQIYAADEQGENSQNAYEHAQSLIIELAANFLDPIIKETVITHAFKRNLNTKILFS
jgi:hypothetical protein